MEERYALIDVLSKGLVIFSALVVSHFHVWVTWKLRDDTSDAHMQAL